MAEKLRQTICNTDSETAASRYEVAEEYALRVEQQPADPGSEWVKALPACAQIVILFDDLTSSLYRPAYLTST